MIGFVRKKSNAAVTNAPPLQHLIMGRHKKSGIRKMQKAVIFLCFMLSAFSAMADKYNFDFCKGCDSGDISDYFNRDAGKSPVYRGDMAKGTITGYERYVIQEPGYPGWYGVRTVSVPQELKQSFDEMLHEYNKLNHYLNTGYEYDENGNLIGHNPKPYVKKKTKQLSTLLEEGDQEGIWVPSDITDSTWHLVNSPSTQNQVINHVVNAASQDMGIKVLAYLARLTTFVTLAIADVKTPGPVVTAQIGKWDSGQWEYNGELRIEINVVDVSDNYDGEIDWSTVKDKEGNNIPRDYGLFNRGSPYSVTSNNVGPYLGTLLRINAFEAYSRMMNQDLPVITTCFAPGVTCTMLPF